MTHLLTITVCFFKVTLTPNQTRKTDIITKTDIHNAAKQTEQDQHRRRKQQGTKVSFDD